MDLPLEFITSPNGILAKKGAGKTSAAVVLLEEMHQVGVPVIVVDPKGDWVLTATIVTSDAVQTLAGTHDRNPVILPEHIWLHWLDPSLIGDQALVDEAVHAGVAEASGLEFDAVSPFGIRANGPELLEPLPQ